MMRTVLVTGGGGFIGCHLTQSLLRDGHNVTVLDAFSRPGSERNVAWLQSQRYPGRLNCVQGDVRDYETMRAAVRGVEVIYHLAAQVAVTSAVTDPRTDFEINALGTLNVLEAARLSERPPIIVFSSTNKVYGRMGGTAVVETPTRYQYRDFSHGIPETQPLDFHSPYGCSKGAADQYVHDYARIYGLRTVVLRQSCIYGTRQFGNEDQGWLAHFVIAAVTGRPITIYGDGKQVRDILSIDDLVRALRLVVERIDVAAGQVYNIGGGPANTLSVWREFGPILSELKGEDIDVRYGEWRPGDQPCFISDIRKAARDLGWQPEVGTKEGIGRLWDWVAGNRDLFSAPAERTAADAPLPAGEPHRLRQVANGALSSFSETVVRQPPSTAPAVGSAPGGEAL